MNNNNILPDLIEPMKILHAQQQDSFFQIHSDFLKILFLFISIFLVLLGLYNHTNLTN